MAMVLPRCVSCVKRASSFLADVKKTCLTKTVCSGSTLSASNVAQLNQYEYLRCEKDPRSHSHEDLGHIYTMPAADVKAAFVHGYPREFQEISAALGAHRMLIRKPAIHIINALQQRKTQEAPRFLLHGADGSGKSITLLHALHYCYLAGWLVIHVPNGHVLAINRKKESSLQASSWNDERYDQPDEAMQWLKCFKSLNRKFLTEKKTSRQYTWGKREATEKNQPLNAILEQGLSRGSYATDAVGILLREACLVNDTNVLYAVDGFNGLFGATSHKIGTSAVDVDRLALVRHFTKLLEDGKSLKNGCYVMALSRTGAFGLRTGVSGTSPDCLLPAKALQSLGNCVSLEVHNYSDEEFRSIMSCYKADMWISKELTPKLLEEVGFISRRNPLRTAKLCASL